MNTKAHVTVQQGEPIQLVKCMQCCNKYHCPFCRTEVFKPTDRSKLLKHIQSHEKRAVQFKDYVIFKCNLTCRSDSHFHCPKCCKLVDKRCRFLDHLEKCVDNTPYVGRGHYLPVKVETDSIHESDETEHHPAHGELEDGQSPGLAVKTEWDAEPQPKHNYPSANPQHSELSSTSENLQKKLDERIQKGTSSCSEEEGNSRPKAISINPSQGSSLFKSSEVSVNTQCFLELFQLCWRCHRDCCITIEDQERLFVITQECPSCRYLRQWKSHPTSPDESAETDYNHSEGRAALYPEVEHTVKDETGKEVQIVSSDNEASLPSFEQMFIEIDGSYLSSTDENGTWTKQKPSGHRCDSKKQETGNTSLQEEVVKIKEERAMPQDQESGDDWKLDMKEEAIVSDVSMDEDVCYEQSFIEEDGTYLSPADKSHSLQEDSVDDRSRSEEQDTGDEQEPDLEEENSDSDVSMDEDLFTALKEDNNLKLVVLCTECETEASLSCSLHRHKKLFCCAHCGDGDDAELRHLEKLPVRFEDFGSFQRHAEKEHGAKPFHKLCRECGKYVIADPQYEGVKDHKCEHKTKLIMCPACGKKFLTEVGLERHYTKLHEDSDHPCKYCLKVFNTSSLKLEHEQTHPKEKQPYSCPDCPEKFDNIHKRNNHLKSHRGSYKYVCDICEKYFKDIIKLRRHKLIHSGEKPYKCQVCERSFNQVENLSSHMCVRSEEKPNTREQSEECLNHNESLKNNQVQHQHCVEAQTKTDVTEWSRESGSE